MLNAKNYRTIDKDISAVP